MEGEKVKIKRHTKCVLSVLERQTEKRQKLRSHQKFSVSSMRCLGHKDPEETAWIWDAPGVFYFWIAANFQLLKTKGLKLKNCSLICVARPFSWFTRCSQDPKMWVNFWCYSWCWLSHGVGWSLKVAYCLVQNKILVDCVLNPPDSWKPVIF